MFALAVSVGTDETTNRPTHSGIVLPFQPLSLSFNHINYYVDMPAVSLPAFLLPHDLRT
jgi:hypothetical protein